MCSAEDRVTGGTCCIWIEPKLFPFFPAFLRSQTGPRSFITTELYWSSLLTLGKKVYFPKCQTMVLWKNKTFGYIRNINTFVFWKASTFSSLDSWRCRNCSPAFLSSSAATQRHGPAAVATSTTFNERQCLPPLRGTCGLLNTLSILKTENFNAETDSSYCKGQPARLLCWHPGRAYRFGATLWDWLTVCTFNGDIE